MSRIVYLYRPSHPKANERGFVDASLVGFEDSDPRVDIVTDRYYEGQKAPDGTDIGSRRKHQAWVKANGLVYHGDFSDAWRAREQKHKAQEQRREIKAAVLESYRKHRR